MEFATMYQNALETQTNKDARLKRMLENLLDLVSDPHLRVDIIALKARFAGMVTATRNQVEVDAEAYSTSVDEFVSETCSLLDGIGRSHLFDDYSSRLIYLW